MFDKIRLEVVINEMDRRETHTVRRLNTNNTTTIRTKLTKQKKYNLTGIRQGGSLSSLLFNMHHNQQNNTANAQNEQGIPVNNLR